MSDNLNGDTGFGANALQRAVVTKANTPLIETVRTQSIQERAKSNGDVASDVDTILGNKIGAFFQGGDVLAPWWSPTRDVMLSEFWKTVNVLAGAMYAMASKMSTIPFHIEPRDPAITSHFREADLYERRINDSAEYGKGWGIFFQKQIQSLLGQDNGRFMEIIDLSPNKDGPIIGPAISVAHLDPSRCQRTGTLPYPVIYKDTDAKLHRLHYTRVAFEAQLPSERVDMHGVGISAVSRATSYAQNMLDLSQYKEEKLGSRPLRGIMVAGGGLDAEMVGEALQIAAGYSDNKGLKRFAMMPIVGNADIDSPDTALNLLSLSSLPDGFDEATSTIIAMSAISLAFGVDARELWPGLDSRSTQAEAIISHIKQRGKGPGHIIAETERMFNNYVLPRYLKFVFDFQDDAQDRQRAEINFERSRARKLNIDNSITDSRFEREEMVREGAMSTAQFKNLELDNGRLPDGKPLGTLFFRDEPVYVEILTLKGISDPTDLVSNDPQKVITEISTQRSVALGILAIETKQIEERQAREALAALEWLAGEYEQILQMQQQEEAQMEQNNSSNGSSESVDPQERQRFAAQKPKTSSESVPIEGTSNIDISNTVAKQLNLFTEDITKQINNLQPNVIINMPEQEPSTIKIDNVTMPEQPAPIINVEVPISDIAVEATLKMPDETVESETIVQRNPITGLIEEKSTITKRK